MHEEESLRLSAEWRAIVLAELKAIRSDQLEMRKDITNQMINSYTKEDFNDFQDKIVKLDGRLTKIESISNRFLGAAVILNLLFVGLIQYFINIFKK